MTKGALLVWSVAGALVVLATLSNSLPINLAIIAVAVVTAIWSNRSRGLNFGFLIWLSLSVILVRIGFRILFSPGLTTGTVLLNLPSYQVALPLGSVSILGPITTEALLYSLTLGSHLAAIVLVVSIASLLTDFRSILRRTPAALMPIALVISMSLSFAPLLVRSIEKIRFAAKLRGHERPLGLRRLLVPVIESAMETAFSQAAILDARGIGFRENSEPRRRWQRVLTLLGLSLMAVSVAAFLLFGTSALVWLLVSFLLTALAVRAGGEKPAKTKFSLEEFQ